MDFPLLKYVDVLIGLSLVMLLVSTIVLAITQVALNLTFARARHLQHGLARLIAGMDPVSMRNLALYVAQLVVRHPLIGRQSMMMPLRRFWRAIGGGRPGAPVVPLRSPGSVVQRDELAFLLIEFAAAEGPLMDPADRGAAPPETGRAQEALAAALRRTGIEDPAATIRAIRLKAVEHERANPTQPAHQWRSNAVADCATSDFIGRLHDGFDSTMARVTDAFAAESQLWVAAVALIVAIALQLDSFALLKRLSIDDKYRETYLQVATELAREKADPSKPPATEQENKTIDDRIAEAKESYALLGSPAISLLPARRAFPAPKQIPGVLLSWVLLSLGAPFWFDLLKNLLKLRSVLAKKDDEQRQDRESKTPSPPAPKPAQAQAQTTVDVAGEAGDLDATGALG